MRLEFCGNLITFFAALFTIVNSDTVSAGMAGLAISYAMQVRPTYFQNTKIVRPTGNRKTDWLTNRPVYQRNYMTICLYDYMSHRPTDERTSDW